MNKLKKILCISLILFIFISAIVIILTKIIQDNSQTQEQIPDNVATVINCLINIDSLQEIQDNSIKYSNNESYEEYRSSMYRAREQVKIMYNSLTDEEKSLIPDELVLKLFDNKII